MRKLICCLTVAAFLTSCAHIVYTRPDGTQIKYTRFMTGADSIRAAVGDANVEANGQRIDSATLQALLNIIAGIR